jgi:hypothetical protein
MLPSRSSALSVSTSAAALILAVCSVLIPYSGADALVRLSAIKESFSPSGASLASPCSLGARPYQEGLIPLDGSCANYRWFNLCSNYIWTIETDPGEASGVLFGGPEQPCVSEGNVVKRAITYFRNVIPGYGYTVDVFLDGDDGDGCPDQELVSDLDVDPALRWNCSEFDYMIPAAAPYIIVRARNDALWPYHATDFGADCNDIDVSHSYGYYSWANCVRWDEIVGRPENFPYWLIIDTAPNSTRSTSWGAVKGLFR